MWVGWIDGPRPGSKSCAGGRVSGKLPGRKEPGDGGQGRLNMSQLSLSGQEGQEYPGLDQCGRQDQSSGCPSVLSTGELIRHNTLSPVFGFVPLTSRRCWSLSRERQQRG